MSEKKSKSKSKQKIADKPPKDTKSKKSKADDTKSKKSVDKGSKKDTAAKSPQKKSQKPGLDQSQDISFFNKPILTQNLFLLDESLCTFHKLSNTIFCQICQQPGCEQCLIYGPHNNQMHRITKIDQAFKSRYLYLNEIVCGQLIERRDKLSKRLDQLTVMSDQLRYLKNGIEKNTKIEYNQMLERLRTSSGGKFAILHHQMAELQKDLQSINALGNQFFELTNMNPQISNIPLNNPNKGMVPFLLRARFLQQQAQQLISKPIKISVDVYPYDLPREITQKKMILQKNKKWIQLLQIKDQTIWLLVEQKKSIQKKVLGQFQSQAKNQIDQWMKLKEQIENQLKQYQMKCKKCQIGLGNNNVNEKCMGGYHEFC